MGSVQCSRREVGRKIISTQALWRVSTEARNYHWITTKLRRKEESQASLVIARFVHLLGYTAGWFCNRDGFEIAHCMQHEDCVMATSLRDIDEDQVQVWEGIPKCCTWDLRLLRIVFGDNNEHKSRTLGSKLTDLHERIAPDEGILRLNAHVCFNRSL